MDSQTDAAPTSDSPSPTGPAADPETAMLPQWPEWATAYRPRLLNESGDLYARFFSAMRRLHPQILWGLSADGILDDHLAARMSVTAEARDSDEEVLFANWWDSLIAAGNQFKRWQVSLLPSLVRRKSHPAAFTARDCQLLEQFRQLEGAFLAALSSGITNDQVAGAILVSSLIFGGLTSFRTLQALLDLKVDDVKELGGRLRVRLHVKRRGAEQTEKHRWYPDSMTAALIVRALRTGLLADLRGTGSLGRRIDAAFKRLSLPMSGSMKDLVRSARSASGLYLRPYCREYLADVITTSGLGDAALAHLCQWEGPILSTASQQAVPSNGNVLGTAVKVPDLQMGPHHADQHDALNALANLLEAKTGPASAQLNQLVADYQGRLWPITYMLFQWSLWTIGANKAAGHQATKLLAASSAGRYLRAVRHLIDIAETEDVRLLELEDFEDLYQWAAVRILHEKERGRFWSCARLFHDFLYLTGSPQVDFNELDGFTGGSPTGSSSALLVTEAHFKAFKKALLGDQPLEASRTRMQVFLAGMLGYRVGLRRSEVLFRWLHDLHLGRNPFIVIRASRLFRLKTRNAERRIPLRGLVPEDELDLLIDYASRTKAQSGSVERLLFSMDSAPKTPLPAEHLFGPVTALFQTILGPTNPSFRFHHLRHSAANWLFLALLAADEPELVDASVLPVLKDAPYLTEGGQNRIKDVMYPRMSGTPETIGRRHLYLVARFLGHLSPLTTLRYYLHLVDYLAGQECELALPERIGTIGPKALASICGIRESRAFQKPLREKRSDAVEFLKAFVARYVPARNQTVLRDPKMETSKAADLSAAIDGISDPPPMHPTTLMLAVTQYLAGQPRTSISHVHRIPVMTLDRAMRAFQTVFAPQGAVVRLLPQPPRNLTARNEFWRMLTQSYAAYQCASDRTVMHQAGSALVNRIGPRRGNTLYLGRAPLAAPDCVKGLIAIGIPDTAIQVIVRSAGHRDPETAQAIAQLARNGVAINEASSSWTKRRPKRDLLSIEIDFGPEGIARGRRDGLNWITVWLSALSVADSD